MSNYKAGLIVVCRCPAHCNWCFHTQQVKYREESKHRLEVEFYGSLFFSVILNNIEL